MLDHVISLEDYKDPEIERLISERDWAALARYLSQWDCGEYHEDPIEHGSLFKLQGADISEHSIENAGEYVLCVQDGHASLYVQRSED